MRLRRFAAGTQPSLLQRRFFTNLQRVKREFITPPFQVCVILYVFSSDVFRKPAWNKYANDIHIYIFVNHILRMWLFPSSQFFCSRSDQRGSPLSVLSFSNQLDHVSALDRQLLRSCLLVVCHHRVLPWSLKWLKTQNSEALKNSRRRVMMEPGLRLTSFFPASSSVSEFMGSSLLEYPLFSSKASTDKDALFQP